MAPCKGRPLQRRSTARTRPSQQLLVEERLDHEVVGPAREPAHAVGVTRTPGDHDDRQLGVDPRPHAVGRAYAVEQLQPVALLEAEIEQHERRVADLDLADALRGPGGSGHRIPVGRQVVG